MVRNPQLLRCPKCGSPARVTSLPRHGVIVPYSARVECTMTSCRARTDYQDSFGQKSPAIRRARIAWNEGRVKDD